MFLRAIFLFLDLLLNLLGVWQIYRFADIIDRYLSIADVLVIFSSMGLWNCF